MGKKTDDTAYRLRDALLFHKRTEMPPSNEDPAIKELHDLLYGYDQYVIEETFSALQGDVKTLDFAEKLSLLDLVLQRFEDMNNQRSNALADRMRKYKTQSDKLLDLALELKKENVLTEKKTDEKCFGDLTETIYNAKGMLEAEMIYLFLQSFGIFSRVIQESAGITFGLTVGSLGLAGIRVAEDDAKQTRAILKAMEEGVFILQDEDDLS